MRGIKFNATYAAALVCVVITALGGCATSNGERAGAPSGQAGRYLIQTEIRQGANVIGAPPVEVAAGRDASADWNEYLLGVAANNRPDGSVDVTLRFFVESQNGYKLLCSPHLRVRPGEPSYVVEGISGNRTLQFGVIATPMAAETEGSEPSPNQVN